MKPLERRIAALEGPAPEDARMLALDALGDVDLERLIVILQEIEDGTPIEELPEMDLRLIASLSTWIDQGST